MSADTSSRSKFNTNNFDLIRLVAAVQVAVYHVVHHLKTGQGNSLGLDILNLFPGVPVFFFVSGFLISKSYENSRGLSNYVKNRLLRIYPALVVCTLLALLSVYIVGYFSTVTFTSKEFFIWFLSQLSFFQFYTPDFMRAFGVGTLNGNLWTISVELQFYILIPILYFVLSISQKQGSNKLIVVLIAVFMIINIAYNYLLTTSLNSVYFKLFGVSFAPWIYMFLIGVLFQRKFEFLHNMLAGKFIFLMPVYICIYYVGVKIFGLQVNNNIGPVLYFLLAGLVFSAAYSYISLSALVLKGNDISYGLYIYHAPVINIMLYNGYFGSEIHSFIALLVSLLLATCSWYLVEKPGLKLKKVSLNSLVVNVK